MSQDRKSDHADLSGAAAPNITVRQDRFDSAGRLTLEAAGESFVVANYSVFGMAVFSPQEISRTDIFSETRLQLNGEIVAELSLEVRRKTKTAHGWEYGLETTTEVIPVERIQYLNDIQSAVATLIERAEKTAVLPMEVRCYIYELAAKLREFESLAKSFEAKPYGTQSERNESFKQVVKSLGREIFHQIKTTNHRLQNLVSEKPEEIVKEAFHFFRSELGHFIYQSPFTKRSFEKPRGYAGDFEMMNQVYRNDGFAHSLFGSCMEYGMHLHEEPAAVRNRSIYLSDKIISVIRSRNEHLNILSVACGPAEEVKHAIVNLSQEELDRTTFWLLDQDEDALKYAQKNIRRLAFQEKKKISINLLHLGIKEAISGKLEANTFDLIYSAGLFDYFSDPVAMRAGKSLARALKAEGMLVLGNFNITSPNWFGMLTLFDWRLILRSDADLTRIFSYPGFRLSVESEPENVNLFCVIRPG